MKILLFSIQNQIEEHAEYIKALKKVGLVEALLLTMGQTEFELGHAAGAFDLVKDILPRLPSSMQRKEIHLELIKH